MLCVMLAQLFPQPNGFPSFSTIKRHFDKIGCKIHQHLFCSMCSREFQEGENVCLV